MKKLYLIFLLIIAGCTSSKLSFKEWHTPTREYQITDSVIVPFADFNKIQLVGIGDSLKTVERKVGFQPIKYYIHPEYAILMTETKNNKYEVAFKLNDKDEVLEISYKKSK